MTPLKLARTSITALGTTLGISLLISSFSGLCLAGTAYITNQGDNTVSVIDTNSKQVINTIKVGLRPVGVAVSDLNHRAYISNVDGQSISVIDTDKNKLIKTYPIKGSPVGLLLSPDHKTLYVADWTDNRIYVLDAISMRIKNEIKDIINFKIKL